MGKAASTHAVIGSGEATEAGIKECLLDVLDEGDTVALIWMKPIPPSVETVYDFVLDNGVQFVMHHTSEQTPAKVFRLAEGQGRTFESPDPIASALRSVSGSGKVLFLWDEDENPALITQVFSLIHPGTLVLELSNGLVPITSTEVEPVTVQEAAPAKDRYAEDEPLADEFDALAQGINVGDPIPAPAQVPAWSAGEQLLLDQPVEAPVEPPAELPEAAEPAGPFTLDELLTMPAIAVKRYGVRIGAKAKTAKGIINELFPPSDPPAAVHRDNPVIPLIPGMAPVAQARITDELNTPSTINPLQVAAYAALKHFFHLDSANAAFHMAAVQYSPITFRLAEALSKDWDNLPEVHAVMAHLGKYPEDSGR